MINIPKDTLMMENKAESEDPPNTNKNLSNNDPPLKKTKVNGELEEKDTSVDGATKKQNTSSKGADGVIKLKDSSVKDVDGVIKKKDSSSKGVDGIIKGKDSSNEGVDDVSKGKDNSVDAEIKEKSSVKDVDVTKKKDPSIDEEIKEKETSVKDVDDITKEKDPSTDDKTKEKDTCIKSKDSSVNGEIKEKETSVNAVDNVKSTKSLENLVSLEDFKDSEDKYSSNNSDPKVDNKKSEGNNITDSKSLLEKSDETSSEIVKTSSSDRTPTKITQETVSQNGLSKPNPSKKKENSSSCESRPDTPMSHGSLDLDLEEKLLHIDADLAQDDQEDFCEEKLLLEESDEEFTLKDKEKEEEEEEEIKSSENESLFDNGEKSLSGKTDEGSTDRQEKEIEKILKSFNSSLENKNTDNNNESTTFRKVTQSNENLKHLNNSSENSNSKLSKDDDVFDESANNSNSNTTSKRKFLDTNSSNSSSLVKRKLSDVSSPSNSKITAKRKLSDSSNLDGDKSLVKAKMPNLKDDDDDVDSNNSKKSAKPNNKLSTSSSSNDGKSSQGEHETQTKLKVQQQSEKNTSKAEITFSEALKSIAMEDNNLFKSISMENNLLEDKPQPLIPTTEIENTDTITPPPTSSLTLLQPISQIRSSSPSVPATDSESDSQGKKRSLPGNFDSLKPDLKRIRFFNDKNSDKTTTESVEEGKTLVDEDETSSQELSRKIKQSSKSRLQEDKESRGLKSGVDKDDFNAMDENDLQRKTVEEMQKNLLSDNKLRRIKRKDLESLIIELFVDKVLYEHQLGQHKDLCKRLETTLESTRKKAAQFHKEIEDLKKVTHRLQAEHLARKSQLVAPVKVKRSVGIQATPTIIGKGLMNVTSHSSIRVLTPSAASSSPTISKSQVSKTIGVRAESQSSNSSSSSPLSSLSSIPSAQDLAKTHKPRDKPQVSLTFINDRNKSTQHPLGATSAKTVNLTAQQQTPGTQVMVPFVVQQSQNGSVGSQLIPVTTTRIVRTPLTPINSSTTQFSTASLPSSVTGASVATAASNATSSSFIDLTDDDEAARNQRASLQAGGLVAVQRATAAGVNSSGQFVTLNPPSSVGQILLVPSPNGQATTALVVGSVANTSPASGVVRTSIAQNSGVRISSPVGIVQPTRAVVGAQMNGGAFVNQGSRHPAPLPRAPPQQTSGYSKKLPPLPTLKLSHKDNSIVLSWNMAKTDEHERIASYQIYAYQEGTAAATPTLWKKVGSVKALELPMACTLTQFMPGHVYHFAVRAVDIRSRLGPFSDPKSIRLGN